jgi:hypothetical protein
MEPRLDVVLTLLLNRACFNAQLMGCYFDLTADDKDSELAHRIAELNDQTVDFLQQALKLVLDRAREMRG